MPTLKDRHPVEMRSLEKIKYLLMLEIASINHSLDCQHKG
jgi:hypothetical protein